MIKAILFDIDGVLIDSKEANKWFYRNLLMAHEYPDPISKYADHLFYLSAWEVIKELTGETQDDTIKPIWENVSTFPYPTKLVIVSDGAYQVLHALKDRFKLGLVTGRVRKGVDDLYGFLQVSPSLFDVAVAFEDYQHPKPHPEPIQIALNQLNVQPNETVYIGDASSDAQAAAAAGVIFIAFDNQTVTTKYHIKTFKQLIPMIEKIKAAKISNRRQ